MVENVEYERERERTIAKNKQRMREVGVGPAATGKKKKGVKGTTTRARGPKNIAASGPPGAPDARARP